MTTGDERRRQGTAKDRRDTERWLIFGLFLFNLIFMCVAIFVGARVLGEVSRVEKNDRASQRATAFRLCSRNAVDRAFAHSRVRRAAGLWALRPLEQKGGIPILNCAPNLDGQGASPLSVHAQRDFVRRWERHELADSELGICPRSRIGEGADKANKC